MAQVSISSIGNSLKGLSRREGKLQIARCAHLAVASLLATLAGNTARADVSTITAFDNATMQPGGPRTGANGKNFFNLEGDNNAANASYGVVDFHGADFGVPTATGVNSLTLSFTESNAAFTNPGSVEVFLASDSSADIQPGTFTAPTYQSGLTPEGIGSTTAFGTLTDLGAIPFNTTGNVNNGTVDSLTLSSLPSAVSAFLANQLGTGGTIRFVLTPGTPSTAATWVGATNGTIAQRQKLSLDVAFPPTGQRTLTFNPTPTSNPNFSTTDTNMLDATNAQTSFNNGDTVNFPNQPIGGSTSFTQQVVVATGGVKPAALNFTNSVGTYVVSGGPIGDTSFGFGRTGITVSGAASTVVLTSSNSFTGGVTINSGTVIIDNDNELGGSGSFSTLSIANGTLLANADIVGSRALNSLASATINTNGHNVTLGSISGTAVGKLGAGSLIATGTVGLNSTLTIGAGNLVMAQPVTAGTGTLSQIFNATVINSFLAPSSTTATAGNFVISTPVAVRVNGGTLQGAGSVFVDTPGALIAISGGSSTTPFSSGIVMPVVLNRNNVGGLSNGQNLPFTANFGANGGTSLGTGSFLTFSFRDQLNLGGVISGNSDVNFGAAANSNSADGVAGGDGIVLLNNTMTYTGATRITTGVFNNAGNGAFGQVSNSPSYGVVRIGVNNALPIGTSVTFGSGSTVEAAPLSVGALDLFGHSQTISYIAIDPSTNSAGGISNFSSESLGAGTGALGTFILDNRTHSQMNFNAPIGALTDGFTNTGAIIMSNDNIAIQLASTNNGTLQLSHANTYTGGTTIGGGTLSLGDPNALGFGSVVPVGRTSLGSTTISTGGVLDMNAQTINEPINLNGGTLMSSNGGGTINNGVKGLGFTAAGTTLSGDASISISGSGSGASATPLLAVTRSTFTLTGGGSGYTVVPKVQVSGGNSAIVIALMGLTNSSVSVTSQGTGYTTAPGVVFNTPTGGVAATGHTTIDGSGHVTGIVIDTAGKGYTAAPVGTLSGGGGTGAAVTGALAGLFVADLSINNGGTAFTSAPSITILPPTTGTQATATADGAHFTLMGIQETSTGSGYITANATLNSSTGAGGAVIGTPNLPTMTLQSTGFIGGDNDINLPVNVTGAGGFTKFGNDTVTISGSTSYTGNVTLSTGTLVFAGKNGWAAALGGTASTTVNGGRLVFDYTGTTTPVTTLRSRLATSYAAGVNSFTTGPFRSAGADTKHGLGYSDDGASKVTVRLTYYGDADLSGQVDTSDFTAMANHFGSTTATWQTGDFNYDGVVNALDFNAVATNFGSPAIPAPTLGALVPEPAAVALLAVAPMLLARRKRAR